MNDPFKCIKRVHHSFYHSHIYTCESRPKLRYLEVDSQMSLRESHRTYLFVASCIQFDNHLGYDCLDTKGAPKNLKPNEDIFSLPFDSVVFIYE